MIIHKCAILLSICSILCDAYKVLLVFPIPGRSHAILGEGYVRHLLKAGHEVTYLTPIPIKNPAPNLRQVDVSENFQYLSKGVFDVQKIMYKELDLQDQVLLVSILNNIVNKTLHTEAVQKFINDPKENFDVVVVEWLYSELGAGFATVFNCPLIWSSSMDPHTFVLSLISDHLNPSYTVHHMSRDYSFSFWDRVYQLLVVSRARFKKWLQIEAENEMFQKAYGSAIIKRGGRLPHYQDVVYNASLMLGNSDLIFGDAIDLPQNYKHIGGYHVKNDTEPLPKDLQNIMDNAKDGVIYFSMGSMLESSRIPDEIKTKILNIFSKLKQTVIWKLEVIIPNLPKNVHIVSWAPQQSILAHPNCVLFITHGGLLSQIETIYYGVPTISTPFFADQYINANRAEAKGFGKRIDFNDNTPAVLEATLKEMLSNSSYRERAKEYSRIFHDRMVSPGKELVYWIEHVIKSKGAPHMRSAALHVNLYKKLYLDLIFVVFVIITLILLAIKYAVSSLHPQLNKKTKLS